MDFSCLSAVTPNFRSKNWGNSFCSKSIFWSVAFVIGKAMVYPQSKKMGWPSPKERNLEHGTYRQETNVMEPPKRRVSEICYIFRSGFQIYGSGQNNTSTETRKSELEGIVNGIFLVHLVTYCFGLNLDGEDSHLSFPMEGCKA